MKKLLFLIVFIPSLVIAEGPLYKSKDVIAQQEFDNVYQDLRNTKTVLSNIYSTTSTWTAVQRLKGTNTNDSAATGYIGEYLENYNSAANFPTSTQWGDLSSVSLTAGDWDVTGIMTAFLNGATTTNTQMGLSSTSGNNSTGLTIGYSMIYISIAPSAATGVSGSLTVRFSLASTTTLYLKYLSTYSAGGPPQAYGVIRARRMR